MNKQNYKIKVLQIMVFVFALLIIQSTAKAQTALEQQCYNAVQGKVAWNQAGTTSWGEANLRNLCRETTNPGATIACFQAEIKQHNDWNRGISACLPEKSAINSPTRTQTETVVERPPNPQTVRTVTLKNSSAFIANLVVRSATQPAETKFQSSTADVVSGKTGTAAITNEISNSLPLLVEVNMRSFDPQNIVIYRAVVSADPTKTNFCIEAKRDAFEPYAVPCEGTKATEAKKIDFRNEAGFIAKPTLNYFVNGVSGSVSTDDTSLGINRILYIPMDADRDKDITLKSTYVHLTGRFNLSDIRIDRNSGSPLCYKVWGTSDAAKISPCSPNPSARKIKFKNMGGFSAELSVSYYDQNQKLQSITGNRTDLLETDVMEIPQDVSSKPIEVSFIVNDGTGASKKFDTKTVPSNFTGEVCFKTEGTVFNPNASTCDDTVGDTSGDTRQIKFQNDGGFDAQAAVMYFEYQTIGGTKISMPKTITTGFINLGKNRMITIPKEVVPGTQITIFLQGNATVKNDIWSTTLPADFKGSPVPCFKVWGWLFEPKGGTCNQ